jgi:hypothetical protein
VDQSPYGGRGSSQVEFRYARRRQRTRDGVDPCLGGDVETAEHAVETLGVAAGEVLRGHHDGEEPFRVSSGSGLGVLVPVVVEPLGEPQWRSGYTIAPSLVQDLRVAGDEGTSLNAIAVVMSRRQPGGGRLTVRVVDLRVLRWCSDVREPTGTRHEIPARRPLGAAR